MKIALLLAKENESLSEYPPLGLGFLMSSVKKALPDIEIFVAPTLEDLLLSKPDLAGISSDTYSYHIAIKQATTIKNTLGIPIILGGIHISLLPESLHSVFDVGVVGEGEITFVELLRVMQNNGKTTPDILRNIRGLAFHEDAGVRLTEPRELVRDLDTLPMPDRRNLPMPPRKTLAHIFSSRGCPYDCSFCSSTRLFKKYRAHSIRTVVDELEYVIQEEKPQYLTFFDDLFFMNKRRLRSLIDELKKRQLIGKCQFLGHGRINLIDDELCLMLRELGLNTLSLGIESFSDKILQYYNKKDVSTEIIEHSFEVMARNNIGAYGLFMFGAPIETAEDVEFTLSKIHSSLLRHRMWSGQYSILTPFPGTPLWNYACDCGIVGKDVDWQKFAAARHRELYIDPLLPYEQLMGIIRKWQKRNSEAVSAERAIPEQNLFLQSAAMN